MYREVAKLILYRDLGEDSILLKLAEIFEDFESGCESKARLITRIYEQMKALLDTATVYGFDKNLWHNYLYKRLPRCTTKVHSCICQVRIQ